MLCCAPVGSGDIGAERAAFSKFMHASIESLPPSLAMLLKGPNTSGGETGVDSNV